MRRYQPEDYSEILEWCFIRDIPDVPKWSLPPNGFIVPGVAVGFLALTDNRCALIDFFISNPLSDKIVRDVALDNLVGALIEAAIDSHAKLILFNTKHPAIKARALKHGFNFSGASDCFEKGI